MVTLAALAALWGWVVNVLGCAFGFALGWWECHRLISAAKSYRELCQRVKSLEERQDDLELELASIDHWIRSFGRD